ncbi:unnamed protein product [Cuscuta epithymum]|uniref:Uncharacterized protein n=1 Tax=Cuscuta epithymum TaxID=186058 RepID=A0AAV0CS65_9ASTE|nr:unnamed protein product [Cuscuta epithymum]
MASTVSPRRYRTKVDGRSTWMLGFFLRDGNLRFNLGWKYFFSFIGVAVHNEGARQNEGGSREQKRRRTWEAQELGFEEDGMALDKAKNREGVGWYLQTRPNP